MSYRSHACCVAPCQTANRGHVCWDEHDLIDGRPTGLVRVSLGWMSTWEDVAAFVSFALKHFMVGTALQVEVVL